jgi:hypothetical protein
MSSEIIQGPTPKEKSEIPPAVNPEVNPMRALRTTALTT